MANASMTALLVNYLKAGAIAWIIWVIMAVIYTFGSLRNGIFMLHIEPGENKRKWSFTDVFILIIWPWGLFYSTDKLVKVIHEIQNGKGVKEK